MGVTSGAGSVYPSGEPEFIPAFHWVRVAVSLVFCVMFCSSLFACLFALISIGHCDVCPSIYGL